MVTVSPSLIGPVLTKVKFTVSEESDWTKTDETWNDSLDDNSICQGIDGLIDR